MSHSMEMEDLEEDFVYVQRVKVLKPEFRIMDELFGENRVFKSTLNNTQCLPINSVNMYLL